MKVAIVGSGPGGMTTAKVLTDAGAHVSMFERGNYEPQTGAIAPYSVMEMERRYRDQGITVALGKPKVTYAEGSCLGGGSEVNAGLYHRTPEYALEAWRKDWGMHELTQAALLPHFEACERAVNVCRMPFPAPAASLKLVEGAAKLGWQCIEAPRWYRYISAVDRGIHSGVRQSMTETVLPTIARDRIDVRTGVSVERIVEHSGSKVSLLVSKDAGVLQESERFDAVFICAGAIGTPWLLKKSSLGPSQVGRNLRLHSSMKLTARFADIVNGPDAGIPVHQVKQFAPDYSFGGSISNLPFMATGLADNGFNPLDLARDWHRHAVYYAMIAAGEGSVGVYPGLDRPIVRFKVSDRGMALLSLALRNLARLLFAAGAQCLYPSIRGSDALMSESDIQRLPGSIDRNAASVMTIHMTGTCPMGESPRACVDATGKLKGARSVYVADASIVPTALGVNPQGTIMALTRYNATRFVAGRQQ
jgi:choline dehydrogenase-like flavoprotein